MLALAEKLRGAEEVGSGRAAEDNKWHRPSLASSAARVGAGLLLAYQKRQVVSFLLPARPAKMGAGGGLIAVLYLAIIFESATMGLILNYAILAIVKYAATEVEQREPRNVILITFAVIGLIGHALTIPCLCFAVQTHKAKWLIPYMVWRMLLSLQIAGIAIWQATLWTHPIKKAEMEGHFFQHFVPIAVGAIIVGTLFFAFAMRTHREFSTNRIQRSSASHSDLYS
uniref:Uncharacterized protein n=2 Tax=Plectus sambesii TaxID=2011161 RepID=A0A914VTD7_9BILA